MPDATSGKHPEDAPPPADSTRMTRRDFHRRAARVAAGLLVSTAASAHADEAAPETGKTPDAETTPGTGSPVPEGLKEAVARVRDAAPSLPADDLPELEAQVKSAMDLSRALHEAATADGTEPGFVFRALLPARKTRP